MSLYLYIQNVSPDYRNKGKNLTFTDDGDYELLEYSQCVLRTSPEQA